MTPTTRTTVVAICAALAAATLVAYSGAFSNGFVGYDDEGYVTENPHVRQGLTPASVAWAFTTMAEANWHPLTWMSHMTDVTVFDLDAGGHHLVSVALHASNAVLLFLVLVSMTAAPWRSALAAGLFALHPTLQGLDVIPTADRIANSALSYAGYLVRTVWPASLAVFYPYPHVEKLAVPVAVSALLLAGTTAAAWRIREKAPFFPVSWLWYVGWPWSTCGKRCGSTRTTPRRTSTSRARAWQPAALKRRSRTFRPCSAALPAMPRRRQDWTAPARHPFQIRKNRYRLPQIG